MAATVAAPRSRSRSAAITRAPARPKASAAARPIPAPAPVMTIDFPCKSSYIRALPIGIGRQVHQSARPAATRHVLSGRRGADSSDRPRGFLLLLTCASGCMPGHHWSSGDSHPLEPLTKGGDQTLITVKHHLALGHEGV